MSRIAYVNGRYLRHSEAAVHIEDRGYQFSDGVYEVCGVRDGLLMDEDYHLERLERSLRELRIAMPMAMRALRHVIREVVRQNDISDGMVYLQVTRGVAKRDHPFPNPPVRPALVITAKPLNLSKIAQAVAQGVAVVTMPDQRWRGGTSNLYRCWPIFSPSKPRARQGPMKHGLLIRMGL